MIEAIVDGENRRLEVKAKGTVISISANTAYLINTIYRDLKQANPSDAAFFKKCIRAFTEDPESPMWEGDAHESPSSL